MSIIRWPADKEIILAFLGGPHYNPRDLVEEKKSGERQKWNSVIPTMAAEGGGSAGKGGGGPGDLKRQGKQVHTPGVSQGKEAAFTNASALAQ